MYWKEIIAQLNTYGLTQPQIAHLCGCSQTAISDLYVGRTADPRYSLGVKLKTLRLREQRRAERAQREFEAKHAREIEAAVQRRLQQDGAQQGGPAGN